jgi:hypothetical protein
MPRRFLLFVVVVLPLAPPARGIASPARWARPVWPRQNEVEQDQEGRDDEKERQRDKKIYVSVSEDGGKAGRAKTVGQR